MSFNFIEEQMQNFGVKSDAVPESIESGTNDVDELMSEAERRFSKAKYYEVLIKEPIFEGDTSPMALEVVKEIQSFSRERLSILLGIKSERQTITSEFSPEEIAILKEMANRLLKKPALGGIQAPANPVLRKAEAPKGPVVKSVKNPEPKVTKSETKPKSPAKRTVVETEETLEIPQKDGSSRKYRKVLENGHEVWLGENGNRHVLETSEGGSHYMRSIQRQSRPTGVQPLQALNEQAMAQVAAQQAQAVSQSQDAVTSSIVGLVNK